MELSEITTKEQAAEYFERIVQANIERGAKSRNQAEYWAYADIHAFASVQGEARWIELIDLFEITPDIMKRRHKRATVIVYIKDIPGHETMTRSEVQNAIYEKAHEIMAREYPNFKCYTWHDYPHDAAYDPRLMTGCEFWLRKIE